MHMVNLFSCYYSLLLVPSTDTGLEVGKRSTGMESFLTLSLPLVPLFTFLPFFLFHYVPSLPQGFPPTSINPFRARGSENGSAPASRLGIARQTNSFWCIVSS